MKNQRIVLKIGHDFTSEPADTSIKDVTCLDFFNSTKKFIDDSFRGAVKINCPKNACGYISIAPKLFAYFMKVLIYETRGDVLILASMEYADGFVNLKIERKDRLKLGINLADIASRAGFSVLETDKEIIISTKVKYSVALKIYARDTMNFIYNYFEVFLDNGE